MIEPTMVGRQISAVSNSASNLGTMPITVLVAEDLSGMRNHMTGLIRQIIPDKLTVLEAANGVDCVKLALEHKPNLVIMDIAMPLMNGIKAAQKIWQEEPSIKILFWSQYHREIYIRDLAKIVPDETIHGYILKSQSDENVGNAVRCILFYNNPYIDPVVRGIKQRLNKKSESLTDVEFDTLHDMCLGLTDRAISLRRHISVRGVQNRVTMLEAKLLKGEHAILRNNCGVEFYNTRARAIFEAFRRGLLDVDKLNDMDTELRDWIKEDIEVNP